MTYTDLTYDDCHWVAVQHQHTGGRAAKPQWSKRQLIHADDLAGWIADRGNRDVYASLQRYARRDVSSDHTRPLAFDVDAHNPEEFPRAYESVRFLRHFATHDLGLPLDECPELLRLWYSGRRGWHAVIDSRVFGLTPQADMSVLMREATWAVDAAMRRVHPFALAFDNSIHGNPRQWRIAGSYRTDADSHKIEFGWKDFLANGRDWEHVNQAAKQARPRSYDDALVEALLTALGRQGGVPEARDWLADIKAHPVGPPPPDTCLGITDGAPTSSPEISPGSGVGRGRNAWLFEQACVLRDLGWSEAEVADELTPWLTHVHAAEIADGVETGDSITREATDSVRSAFSRRGREWRARHGQVEVIPASEMIDRPGSTSDDRTTYSDVRNARDAMYRVIEAYLDQAREDPEPPVLYVQGTQGLGKSWTAERAIVAQAMRGIFAKPRHELIVETEGRMAEHAEGCGTVNRRFAHICPRVPRTEVGARAEYLKCVCRREDEVARYQNAQHDVFRGVCSTPGCYDSPRSECPYYTQLDARGGHVGVVHNLLFVGERMRDLLRADEGLHTALVLDEPSLATSVPEQTITTDMLSGELQACDRLKLRGTDLRHVRGVLSALSRVASQPRGHTPDHHRRGRALYEMIASLGIELGEDLRGHGIDDQMDTLEAHSAADLRQNFVRHLFEVVLSEWARFTKPGEFNGRLTLRGNGTEGIFDLRRFRSIEIARDVPIIVLDPHITEDIVGKITGRPVCTARFRVPVRCSVHQCVTSKNGAGQLWDGLDKTLKPRAEKLLQTAATIVADRPMETLIVTWKTLVEHVRYLLPGVAVAHYGNIEGINTYEDCERVILMGTFSAPEHAVLAAAEAVYCDDPDPVDWAVQERWRTYRGSDGLPYRDSRGRGYRVATRIFTDSRAQNINEGIREQEMIQAAHRIRPVRPDDAERVVYVLSSLPLADLPPTVLFDEEEVRWAQGEAARPWLVWGVCDDVLDGHGVVTLPLLERVLTDIDAFAYLVRPSLLNRVKATRLNDGTRQGTFAGIGVVHDTVRGWVRGWAVAADLDCRKPRRMEATGPGVFSPSRGRPAEAYVLPGGPRDTELSEILAELMATDRVATTEYTVATGDMARAE